MLVYSFEQNPTGSSPVQRTLHLKGTADASQWERLKTLFFDSLNNCDHLHIEIEDLDEYDCSFAALICCARRTAHLLGKQLTIEGKGADSFPCLYASLLHSRDDKCTFALGKPCSLGKGEPLMLSWSLLAGVKSCPTF